MLYLKQKYLETIYGSLAVDSNIKLRINCLELEMIGRITKSICKKAIRSKRFGLLNKTILLSYLFTKSYQASNPTNKSNNQKQ